MAEITYGGKTLVKWRELWGALEFISTPETREVLLRSIPALLDALEQAQVWSKIRFDEETQTFVGFCSVLNIYSQGTTAAEAEQALQSAVKLWTDTMKERLLQAQAREDAAFNEGVEAAAKGADSGFRSCGSTQLPDEIRALKRQEAHDETEA